MENEIEKQAALKAIIAASFLHYKTILTGNFEGSIPDSPQPMEVEQAYQNDLIIKIFSDALMACVYQWQCAFKDP